MDEIDATQVQIDKYEKFLKDPRSRKVIKFLRVAVAAAELKDEDRGVYWGVTVYPEKAYIARLNVANRIVLQIDTGGRVSIYYIEQELGRRYFPKFWVRYDGFKKISGSKEAYFFRISHAKRALKNKQFRRAYEAHAKTQWRTLPDTNWHNPLTNSFLI